MFWIKCWSVFVPAFSGSVRHCVGGTGSVEEEDAAEPSSLREVQVSGGNP